MGQENISILAPLVARLGSDPAFMAHTLAAYQAREGLSDQALAEQMGATPEMITRLALCRRPDSEGTHLAAQMQALSDYTLISEAALTKLIRRAAITTEAPTEIASLHLRSLRQVWSVLVTGGRGPALVGALAILLIVLGFIALARRSPAPPQQAQYKSEETATPPVLSPPHATQSIAPAPAVTPPSVPRRTSPTAASTSQAPELIATIKLDLSKVDLQRGIGTDPNSHQLWQLPRSRARLVITLPQGSASGRYHVSLSNATSSINALARSADGKHLSVNLDLGQLPEDKYTLCLVVRAGDASSDCYPVRVAAQ